MADYTDYQQRALYAAGQSAARAGQRFQMERDALVRGDTNAAKYHRSRANKLNKQGAYAAVRGMGGNQGLNPYFTTSSSGAPIKGSEGFVGLSSAGRDVFDKFRDMGFVEPIRQKRRYAPNTEPKGIGTLFENLMPGSFLFKSLNKKRKPKPDDAYYKSLWGQGLNELYGNSGLFSPGKFLGTPEEDPYYRKKYTGPEFLRGLLEPFIQPRSDAFGVVRESTDPDDWEFMKETPLDYSPGIESLVPEDIKNEEINAIQEIADSGEGIFYGGRGDFSSDFDYEEDIEGRELSEKISFLQSIYPNVDYNKVAIDMPELIDLLYNQELAKAAQKEEFMHGNIGALNPLQPD